jgi:hypothetical protein
MFSVMSWSPHVMKILRPVMKYRSPRGSARVVSDERSEPACGSVRHIVPVHSPATSFSRVILFQLIGPVAVQRQDGALRQFGAQAESDVGSGPHLLAGDRDGLRQALPPEIGIRRDAGPATLAEFRIGGGECGRDLHLAIDDLHALPVTDRVRGGQHRVRESRRLFEHSLHGVLINAGIGRQSDHVVEVDQVLDRELHLLQWGQVLRHVPLRHSFVLCNNPFCLLGPLVPMRRSASNGRVQSGPRPRYP